MRLIFRNRRLERAYRDPGRAARLWGADVGLRYVERVSRIQTRPTWQDLFRLRQLDLHPLHGDRRGQFAARLTGRWRLILQPGEREGEVLILDVEDYHD